MQQLNSGLVKGTLTFQLKCERGKGQTRNSRVQHSNSLVNVTLSTGVRVDSPKDSQSPHPRPALLRMLQRCLSRMVSVLANELQT